MKSQVLAVAMVIWILIGVQTVKSQNGSPPGAGTTPAYGPPPNSLANGGTSQARADGASLAETMDWLREKLAMNINVRFDETLVMPNSGRTDTTRHRITFVLNKVDGCTMEWEITDKHADNYQNSTDKSSFKVPLGDLEPFGVKVVKHSADFQPEKTLITPDIWDLKLTAAAGKQSVVVQESSLEEVRQQVTNKKKSGDAAATPTPAITPAHPVPYVVIHFLDREMAKRVAKAFEHAITQCGGKPDPF